MALKDVNLLVLRRISGVLHCQASLPDASTNVASLDDCVKDGTLTMEERSALGDILDKLSARALGKRAEEVAALAVVAEEPKDEFYCAQCGGSHCVHNPSLEVPVVDLEAPVELEGEPNPENE